MPELDKSFSTLPEITLRMFILGVILTIVLVMSNAYLALKVGILASASIPAAIISVGVLRYFRNVTILENNLVHTMVVAGEGVAGGIAYTMPALLFIHYWQHFSYWEIFFIAWAGGWLGVLFSVPLRRILMAQQGLRFPEGRAIAEVLIAESHQHFRFHDIIMGSVIGSILELLQTGFRIISSGFSGWMSIGNTIWGIGIGLSAPMIGMGYLVGFNVAISLFLGACLGSFIGIPLLGWIYSDFIPSDLVSSASVIALNLWNEKVRYIGIGAMLTAGLWSLIELFYPFIMSLLLSFSRSNQNNNSEFYTAFRTSRDLPLLYALFGIVGLLWSFYLFFTINLPLMSLIFAQPFKTEILLICVAYLLIIGFLASALCGYFSGLVGATASPGSAIIIASLLIGALLLEALGVTTEDSVDTKLAAAATIIFLGAIITTAAALVNDSVQILKVGHIIGTTPWKQQIMLMVGVVICAIVIPLIMELLFNVYGIGDILPCSGMNKTVTLPGPTAAMIAAVAMGIFNYALPWDMIILGILLAALGIAFNYYILSFERRLSILAFAIGLYLPFLTSCSLFIGGLLAELIRRKLQRQVIAGRVDKKNLPAANQRGILIACGLISGAALMSIALAVVFLLMHDSNALELMPAETQGWRNGLGIVIVFAVNLFIYQSVCMPQKI